ncbi:hypothetical protein PHBOTO_000658 [Pseudozyma hubeiensis]|nr:hypothetical protein PHBOTO_000658 [Pseudozyma hubeiensis]
MSELFDSLNLSTSAGPSSSQQSSSQPSTSKVFWHASPSPGVLRQLANWTPSKSQESPTLPLCTQAFVGELKKLPGAYEAQSPLIARDSAKRKKLRDASRGSARHVSDPTANRVKLREYINLELSEDEEEEENGGSANGPRRLLLGDVGESSPESARRRTMDAGNTGRMRQPSTSSQHSSTHSHTSLPLDKDPPQHVSSHRRLERRPPRRRKKESLIAGLGFTDDSGRATDCLKLFEDLQAAIQGMQSASRPSTSGSADADQRPTVTFDGRSSGGASAGGRLTAREGINRTASAPHASRAIQHSQQLREEDEHPGSPDQQQQDSNGPLTPRRGFRPVKSDHDVFRAAGNARGSEIETRALQPRPINLPAEPRADSQSLQQGPLSKAPIQPSTVLQPSEANVEQHNKASPTAQAVPAEATKSTASSTVRATAIDAPTHATKTATVAQPSPVKRSARIEAMQQTTHNTKKLGVRGPSMLSKSVSPHAKPSSSSAANTLSRKPGPSTTTTTTTTPGRARSLALGKLSQARQPGLPRSCSQSIPASQHCPAAAGGAVGPAAPFRPPAIAARATTTTRTTGREVRSSSPVKRSSSKAGPASSDDSFGDVDDDAAFLALACEFEY